MSYLDINGIRLAFGKHLMFHCGYSSEEANAAVWDFPNPYSNCYLDENYVGFCQIDGEEYEQYTSVTNLWRVGMIDVPEFRFYTYYRKRDMPNRQVGEYLNAKKLYQIDNLNKSDFPDWEIEHENNRELEFCVTICLGHGDGGEVIVTMDVTENEYNLLKECCREDLEIADFEQLEDLYERVIDAAIEESEACAPDGEDDIDYNDASYMVAIPDEIYDEVQTEKDE